MHRYWGSAQRVGVLFSLEIDIAEKVIGADRSIDRTSVYEVMSKPVLTVTTQMNIKYAIRLLSRFQLTRAFVVENEKVVGIVTLRDMAVRFLDVVDGAESEA